MVPVDSTPISASTVSAQNAAMRPRNSGPALQGAMTKTFTSVTSTVILTTFSEQAFA